MVAVDERGMAKWQHGLCGCFNDIGLCLITYIAPCITAGKNAEAVGNDCMLYGCLSILGPISLWSRSMVRGQIREARGIEGSCLNDCVTHCFCGLCALVQEGQEIWNMLDGPTSQVAVGSCAGHDGPASQQANIQRV